MQYVTKRVKKVKRMKILTKKAQKWRFSVKFKDKGCDYHSQYRSRICVIDFHVIPVHIQECKGSFLYRCKRAQLEVYFPGKSLKIRVFLKKHSELTRHG